MQVKASTLAGVACHVKHTKQSQKARERHALFAEFLIIIVRNYVQIVNKVNWPLAFRFSFFLSFFLSFELFLDAGKRKNPNTIVVNPEGLYTSRRSRYVVALRPEHSLHPHHYKIEVL